MQSVFKYFLWLFLAFSFMALLFGVTEMSYLGSYSGQAVWAPIWDFFTQITSGNVGSAFMMVLRDPGAFASSIVNILWWNYATLNYGIGLWFKFLVLIPLSTAFIISLAITLWGLMPFSGGGA